MKIKSKQDAWSADQSQGEQNMKKLFRYILSKGFWINGFG